MTKELKPEKTNQSNVKNVNYRWVIDFKEDLGGKLKELADKKHVSVTAYILWKLGDVVDAEKAKDTTGLKIITKDEPTKK